MSKDIKYSHRSNGNCQCQSCRTKDRVRYDNEATGNASTQDLLDEGVSSREPFDRQMDDYGIYPNW